MRTAPSAQHVSSRLAQPYLQQATGDGARVDFFLDHEPTSPGGLLVFLNGTFQVPDTPASVNDYHVTGAKLTFAAAPGVGAKLTFFTLSV